MRRTCSWRDRLDRRGACIVGRASRPPPIDPSVRAFEPAPPTASTWRVARAALVLRATAAASSALSACRSDRRASKTHRSHAARLRCVKAPVPSTLGRRDAGWAVGATGPRGPVGGGAARCVGAIVASKATARPVPRPLLDHGLRGVDAETEQRTLTRRTKLPSATVGARSQHAVSALAEDVGAMPRPSGGTPTSSTAEIAGARLQAARHAMRDSDIGNECRTESLACAIARVAPTRVRLASAAICGHRSAAGPAIVGTGRGALRRGSQRLGRAVWSALCPLAPCPKAIPLNRRAERLPSPGA